MSKRTILFSYISGLPLTTYHAYTYSANTFLSPPIHMTESHFPDTHRIRFRPALLQLTQLPRIHNSRLKHSSHNSCNNRCPPDRWPLKIHITHKAMVYPTLTCPAFRASIGVRCTEWECTLKLAGTYVLSPSHTQKKKKFLNHIKDPPPPNLKNSQPLQTNKKEKKNYQTQEERLRECFIISSNSAPMYVLT